MKNVLLPPFFILNSLKEDNMKSECMKPENTNLISIGYTTAKNKYYATFQISNMDSEHRKRIIERKNTPFVNRDCKIFVTENKVYIIDYFTATMFETYKSIIEPAKKGLIPQRIDPMVLEQELDFCMLEQDIDRAINLLSKSAEELEERYNIKLKDIL